MDSLKELLLRSLRARLTFGVTAVVLLSTLVLSSAALYLVKRNMQDAIANEQFERTAAIATALDQKFVARKVLLRMFSTGISYEEISEDRLQDYIQAHAGPLRENFDNIAVLDRTGLLVANLNGVAPIRKINVSDRDYFKDTLSSNAGVISQPYQNRVSGKAQIAITQPVIDKAGKIRWVLSGSINLEERNFLGEYADIKFGRTGYMFITTTNGIVVHSPRTSRILKHTNAEGGSNPITDRAIAGFEGMAEGMNRLGVYGLYSFKRLQQTNWIIGSIYPRGEAFVRIERIEHMAWLGALILAILSSGLALFVLHTQMQPLQRLHDHMQQARSENTYVAMDPAPQQREVAEMAATFSQLMFEHQTAQSALRQQEAYLSGVLTHAPDAFISINTEGEITEWNRQAEMTFGWSRAEVLSKHLADFLIPTAAQAAHTAGFGRFVTTGTGRVVNRRIEVDALHRDGRTIPIELSVAAVQKGDRFAANAFLRDISDRRDAASRLAASEKRVRDIADNIPALIGYFDSDLTLQFANKPAQKLFRLDPDKTYTLATALGKSTYDQHAPYIPRVLEGKYTTFEGVSVFDESSHYQAHMVPEKAADGTVTGMYLMTFDVSRLKEVENKLTELSRLDFLTGLPNRRRFTEKLEEALARSKRTGRALALMFLDVDHFKQINDTHGHAAGDLVLIEFSRRLKAAVRETDTVARLAGDEFVVILEGLHGSEESSLVAAKVVQLMQQPMELEEVTLDVRTSIGVAASEAIDPDQVTAFGRLQQVTAEQLLAEADAALYDAKHRGRNGFAVRTLS